MKVITLFVILFNYTLSVSAQKKDYSSGSVIEFEKNPKDSVSSFTNRQLNAASHMVENSTNGLAEAVSRGAKLLSFKILEEMSSEMTDVQYNEEYIKLSKYWAKIEAGLKPTLYKPKEFIKKTPNKEQSTTETHSLYSANEIVYELLPDLPTEEESDALTATWKNESLPIEVRRGAIRDVLVINGMIRGGSFIEGMFGKDEQKLSMHLHEIVYVGDSRKPLLRKDFKKKVLSEVNGVTSHKIRHASAKVKKNSVTMNYIVQTEGGSNSGGLTELSVHLQNINVVGLVVCHIAYENVSDASFAEDYIRPYNIATSRALRAREER